MPFSLMIREGSWPVVSARFPALDKLPVYDRYGQNVKFLPSSPQPHEASARAAAIVFSNWERDAKTAITSLDSFEALVRLKDSGFWVKHDRDSTAEFLEWLQSIPSYALTYSDLHEATTFIKRLLAE